MKDDFRSRRAVLRGALAFGGSWWVSTLLSGCDSRKSPAPTTSAAPPPSAPAASADAGASAATKKVTQASVQYQTQPKGEQKCADCLHFITESNTCKLVEGQISPDGWCVLWAKKT